MVLKPSVAYLYNLFFAQNAKPQEYQNACSSFAINCHASEPLPLVLPLYRRQCLFCYLTKLINKILLEPFNLLNLFRIYTHNDLKWALYYIK